jgi:hypothetical protein
MPAAGLPSAAGAETSSKGEPMQSRPGKYLVLPALLLAGSAVAQFPVLDMVADDVVQKYRTATCEQLWQRHDEPKSERAKQAMQMLRDDPQMRKAFIDKVAAPIVDKMFECGLVP